MGALGRRLDQWAEGFAGLQGWRLYGLAFGLGVAATLALPPVYVLPVLYVVFPSILWTLEGTRSKRRSFLIGWWFGFGYFAASLYWIGNALLVFAAKHGWMLPFAVIGIPALLALFTGLAFLIASAGRTALARAMGLVVAWSALEWVRGHALTGFPWNLIGQAWTGNDALAQSAALVGVYGLSFFVLLSACVLALAARQPRRVRWAAAAIAVALPMAAWGFGAARFVNTGGTPASDLGVGLRIVQANIPQREKWDPQFRNRNLRRHLDLSIANRPDWVAHVIWPEMAATFYVEDVDTRQLLARAAPPGGLLITGAPRRDGNRRSGKLHNTALAIDGAGEIVGVYDKFHLVPFGEYVPLREFLPIQKITHGSGGYSPGPGPRTLTLPGLPPVSPLICYEVIFPGAVTDHQNTAEWLLNLTNDAWYGATAGPHQHLAISRLRAIEEGVPMVRAAYTGISAVIDPFGKITHQIGLNESGVIDARLPAPLPIQSSVGVGVVGVAGIGAGRTHYARFGDSLFLILLLIGGAVACFPRTLR
jgi:apolipoprotein N-acyltransferase